MRGILEGLLKPDDRGIEWGSGRSTAWLAQRVAHLVSVEHNPLWAERVRKLLAAANIQHIVDYRVITDAETEDSPYVSVANEIPVASLDFAFVDGATSVRYACAAAALDRIRPGGFLIIDNCNWFLPGPGVTHAPNSVSAPRQDWENVAKLFLDWRCVWTSDGVTDTAFWIKPCL
jgi:predicted O-methyltransferase YrrM